MKNLKQLYEELSNRTDFVVDIKGFDGGKGHFISGSKKGNDYYMELRRRLATREYRWKETDANMGGNVPVKGYVL